jgi:flagellar biosynthetic protein FliO
MTPMALASWAPDPAAWPSDGSSLVRSVMALAIVFGLLALLVWLLRRGTFAGVGLRKRPGAIAVETAVPLGERRSLVVVSVEGRRLLLGISPVQVSLLTELTAAPPTFEDSLTRSVGPVPGRPS